MISTILEALSPIVAALGGVGGFIGAITGIIGCVSGIIALLQTRGSNSLAQQANNLAATANEKSEGANTLAKEANTISLKSWEIASDNTSYDWQVMPNIEELRFDIINNSLYDVEEVEIVTDIFTEKHHFYDISSTKVKLYPSRLPASVVFDCPELEEFIRCQREQAFGNQMGTTVTFRYSLIIGWTSERGKLLNIRKNGIQKVTFEPDDYDEFEGRL